MSVAQSAASQRPRFACLKDLTDGGKAGLTDGFTAMAALLESAGFDIGMEFQIRVGETFQAFSLRVADARSAAGTGSLPDADVVVITTEETWQEIARGGLSPLEAFGAGRMRLRGDTRLAVKALKHLAGTPGRTEIC